MKKRNFLMMAALLFGMTLAACGGKPAEPSSEAPQPSTSEVPQPSSSEEPQPSSSEAPQPSSSEAPQPSSSEAPQPSSSEEPPSTEKAVTVTSVNLIAKENKVYLQLAGAAENYTAAEFKWALALQHAGQAGAGDGKTTYILGTTAEFVDADYTLDATLNADGSYVFEYNLSTIEGLEAGIYTIHAGVKGLAANLAVGTVNNAASLKDGTYRFYIRADVNNQNSIAVDELPPVTITEASVVMGEDGKAWAKIGGEADESITQEVLDSFDSFVQFQQVGGSWTNTRRYKTGTYIIPGSWGRPDTELVVEEDQYYWKKEGNKAYLYADVSFFAAGSNYNTHLNARHPEQADLKMEVALDEHCVMTNANGVKLDVNVVAVPGASAQDDFWGNLGWKVTAWKDPSAHVHTLVDGTPENNSDGFAVTPFSCSGCNKVGAKMAVASFTGNADPTKTDYKHDNNTTVTYKIIAPKAGDYELKIGAFVANNRTKDLTATPYTVKLGEGESAVAVPVSTGTYDELGIGTNAGAQFVLCPTITLAQGENVIAITQGAGGFRLTFQGLVEIYEK